MDYIKVSFTINPDTVENREIFIAMISVLPFESFSENEDSIEAFIPENSHNTNDINEQIAIIPLEVQFKSETIKTINWNEEWEKNYFKPLHVNDQCIIRAPFHESFPETKYEIIINPKMAFGTGNHETTLNMMLYLFDLDLKDKNILDMGCGSGILSIMASKLGARSITAIDIDEWSYENTIENAELNDINNITPILGDAQAIPNKKFDVILANIHKNIIINDMKLYNDVLNKNGDLILSGFYEHDVRDVKNTANNLGLCYYDTKKENKWVAVRHQK